MTDRELLKLAAKAMRNTGDLSFANFDYASEESGICLELRCKRGAITAYWNPLADDGDALRLAVKLQMHVQINEASSIVETWQSDDGETKEITEYFDPPQDPYAATRRAIVRAAAEIGKERK